MTEDNGEVLSEQSAEQTPDKSGYESLPRLDKIKLAIGDLAINGTLGAALFLAGMEAYEHVFGKHLDFGTKKLLATSAFGGFGFEPVINRRRVLNRRKDKNE
jgi:hypothetical protein